MSSFVLFVYQNEKRQKIKCLNKKYHEMKFKKELFDKETHFVIQPKYDLVNSHSNTNKK